MSSIYIKETCTGSVPNAAPSAASFGTDAVGMAVKVLATISRNTQVLQPSSPGVLLVFWSLTQWLVLSGCL